MSNNDLRCNQCKGQHHPADDCMTETKKASERDELARKFKELSNKHGFRGHSAEMLCEEQAEIVLAREQSLKQELAQSIEYQDSLHEKIATLEAELDCRILLSEHNKIVEDLRCASEYYQKMEEDKEGI